MEYIVEYLYRVFEILVVEYGGERTILRRLV